MAVANVAGVSRRIFAVVVALVAALTLSSCGDAVTQGDVVAEVDDAQLTGDELEAIMSDPVVTSLFQTPAPADGSMELNAADQIATVWVWLEATTQQDIAQLDDEAVAKEQLKSALGDDAVAQYDATTGAVRTFLTRVLVVNQQLRAEPPSVTADELREASRAADVRVDSRYGYWDLDRASILRFGVEPAPLAPTTTIAS